MRLRGDEDHPAFDIDYKFNKANEPLTSRLLMNIKCMRLHSPSHIEVDESVSQVHSLLHIIQLYYYRSITFYLFCFSSFYFLLLFNRQIYEDLTKTIVTASWKIFRSMRVMRARSVFTRPKGLDLWS